MAIKDYMIIWIKKKKNMKNKIVTYISLRKFKINCNDERNNQDKCVMIITFILIKNIHDFHS